MDQVRTAGHAEDREMISTGRCNSKHDERWSCKTIGFARLVKSWRSRIDSAVTKLFTVLDVKLRRIVRYQFHALFLYKYSDRVSRFRDADVVHVQISIGLSPNIILSRRSWRIEDKVSSVFHVTSSQSSAHPRSFLMSVPVSVILQWWWRRLDDRKEEEGFQFRSGKQRIDHFKTLDV